MSNLIVNNVQKILQDKLSIMFKYHYKMHQWCTSRDKLWTINVKNIQKLLIIIIVDGVYKNAFTIYQ